MTPQEMVLEFHKKFGHPISDSPQGVSLDLWNLRIDLIKEELKELIESYALLGTFDGNKTFETPPERIVEAADALGDLIYVVYGMAICMGIDLDAVVAEIHRSNMTKLGEDGKPIYRPDGKVLKGPNYEPPNLAKVLGFDE